MKCFCKTLIVISIFLSAIILIGGEVSIHKSEDGIMVEGEDLGSISVMITSDGVKLYSADGLHAKVDPSVKPDINLEGGGSIIIKGYTSACIYKGYIKLNKETQNITSSDTDTFPFVEEPKYVLGVGDKIDINVYNVEEMHQAVILDAKNHFIFPLIGEVSTEGLTVGQLQDRLEELLAPYVKDPHVAVQVIDYQARWVNVIGEVRLPGKIIIKGTMKILDTISQAGGFSEKGGDVEVQRKDSNGNIHSKTLLKEDLLSSNNEKINFYVLPGDTLNVLEVKQLYITGEVVRPGAFAYKKDLTLLKIVTLAGGLTQWAKKGRIEILRRGQGGIESIKVDLKDIEKGKQPDFPLKPDDHIVVGERKFF